MPEPSPAVVSPSRLDRIPLLNLVVALLLGSFCILYWWAALHLGAREHLANDDVYTLWMIKSPSIIGALKLGADTAPPLSTGLCRHPASSSATTI